MLIAEGNSSLPGSELIRSLRIHGNHYPFKEKSVGVSTTESFDSTLLTDFTESRSKIKNNK